VSGLLVRQQLRIDQSAIGVDFVKLSASQSESCKLNDDRGTPSDDLVALVLCRFFLAGKFVSCQSHLCTKCSLRLINTADFVAYEAI
jgi:hypothetical protein